MAERWHSGISGRMAPGGCRCRRMTATGSSLAWAHSCTALPWPTSSWRRSTPISAVLRRISLPCRTSTGVLVVSAPKDSGLGLNGGDVVLAVDGRKPAGPSQLLRILRSYERGETFKVDILRKQKREVVTGRVGDRPTD